MSVEQEGRRQRTHRSYPFEAGHFDHLAAFHADLAAMLEQGHEALSLAETAGVPLARSMSHIDIAAALYAETLDAGLETALA